MGSADWMPRNLDKRVEIMFPVEDPALKEQVIPHPKGAAGGQCESPYPAAGWHLRKDYKRGKVLVTAQQQFCEEAIAMAKAAVSRMMYTTPGCLYRQEDESL